MILDKVQHRQRLDYIGFLWRNTAWFFALLGLAMVALRRDLAALIATYGFFGCSLFGSIALALGQRWPLRLRIAEGIELLCAFYAALVVSMVVGHWLLGDAFLLWTLPLVYAWPLGMGAHSVLLGLHRQTRSIQHAEQQR